jgi:hypothetical protein
MAGPWRFKTTTGDPFKFTASSGKEYEVAPGSDIQFDNPCDAVDFLNEAANRELFPINDCAAPGNLSA